MKRFGFALLVVAIVLLAFWVGLMLNFPGASVSRYVERSVNSHQGFDLALTPAELRWNRLYVAQAQLRRRDNPAAQPLFTLRDFSIPITWRLIQGLPAYAGIGTEGTVEAFLPWALGAEASLDGQLNLRDVPVPEVVQPLAVSGPVEVHGRFVMDAQSRAGTQLPDGTLEAVGRTLEVSGVRVGAQVLPSTRLEALNVVLKTGRTVNVERFEYRGDMQGNIVGNLTPNLRDPRSSRLAMRITAAFRDTWLLQLGDMRPVVESFLDGGRVVVALNGTVGRPQLTPVRRGTR